MKMLILGENLDYILASKRYVQIFLKNFYFKIFTLFVISLLLTGQFIEDDLQ